jgi:hypothetical protein
VGKIFALSSNRELGFCRGGFFGSQGGRRQIPRGHIGRAGVGGGGGGRHRPRQMQKNKIARGKLKYEQPHLIFVSIRMIPKMAEYRKLKIRKLTIF